MPSYKKGSEKNAANHEKFIKKGEIEEERNTKTGLMYIISWERKVLRQVFQMTWDSITQLQGCF